MPHFDGGEYLEEDLYRAGNYICVFVCVCEMVLDCRIIIREFDSFFMMV